jgi:hypothetical protein
MTAGVTGAATLRHLPVHFEDNPEEFDQGLRHATTLFVGRDLLR